MQELEIFLQISINLHSISYVQRITSEPLKNIEKVLLPFRP